MGCKSKGGVCKLRRRGTAILIGIVSIAMALPLLVVPALTEASTMTDIEIEWVCPQNGITTSIFSTELRVRVTYDGKAINSHNQLGKSVRLEELGGAGLFTRSDSDPEIWIWKGGTGKLNEGRYTLIASFKGLDGDRHAGSKELKVKKLEVYLEEPKWHPSIEDTLVWEFQVEGGGDIVDRDGVLVLDFHPTGGILREEPRGTFNDGVGKIKLSVEQSYALKEKLDKGKTGDGCIAVLQIDNKNYGVEANVVLKLPSEPKDLKIFVGEELTVPLDDLFSTDLGEVGYMILSKDLGMDFWMILWEELEASGLLGDLLLLANGLLVDESIPHVVKELAGVVKETCGGMSEGLEDPETFITMVSSILELEGDLFQYVEDEHIPGGIVGKILDKVESLVNFTLEWGGTEKLPTESTRDGAICFTASEPGLYMVIFTNTEDLFKDLKDSDKLRGFEIGVCNKADVILPEEIMAGEPFIMNVVRISDGMGVEGARITTRSGVPLGRTDRSGVAIIQGIGAEEIEIRVNIPQGQHYAFEDSKGNPVKEYKATLVALEPSQPLIESAPPGISALWVMTIALVVAVVVAALVAMVVRRRRI